MEKLLMQNEEDYAVFKKNRRIIPHQESVSGKPRSYPCIIVCTKGEHLDWWQIIYPTDFNQ
jgi:hypothetical protein